MSAERRPRRRIARRMAVGAGILLPAVAAFAAWLWLPWRRVDGLAVDGVHLTPTSRRIAVDFSVPEDVAAIRRRYGIGFITAHLFACRDRDTGWRHVVSQDGGYLPDKGHAIRLPSVNARVRYRVMFDDRLDRRDDAGQGHFVAAHAVGPLCFGLEGSSMFWGSTRSKTIALPPAVDHDR